MMRTAIVKKHSRKVRWYEKFAALLALGNLILVAFDLSYVPGRDFYLRQLPGVVPYYDQLKGIEPHRDTQVYLQTVNQLEQQLAQSGAQGPEVERLLADLRNQSAAMIDENPFQLANKTGTLEKIKNRMREHLRNESSKQAFNIFWGQAHLTQVGWPRELTFFNNEIRPLIETNYFRRIGETGEFINQFWRIDLFFIGFFGVEFLIRTFYLSRRRRGVAWVDAMIWRWYDIFLLIPFGLPPFGLIPFGYWLRVIPVTIRLHQANLLNLERVQAQLNHSLAANLAAEVTDLVFIGVINQAKSSIRKGEITRLFARSRAYVEINDLNELEAIASRLLQLTVYKVLPKVQPDLEALLRHNIENVLNQSPIYQNFQRVPAISQLRAEMTEQLAGRLYQSVYNTLTTSLQDREGGEIFSHLIQHFSEAFSSELQDPQTTRYIQTLLLALLEEVKLTYLQHPTEEDIDQTLAEVAQSRQVVHEPSDIA
jgi:hypothetical protein